MTPEQLRTIRELHLGKCNVEHVRNELQLSETEVPDFIAQLITEATREQSVEKLDAGLTLGCYFVPPKSITNTLRELCKANWHCLHLHVTGVLCRALNQGDEPIDDDWEPRELARVPIHECSPEERQVAGNPTFRCDDPDSWTDIKVSYRMSEERADIDAAVVRFGGVFTTSQSPEAGLQFLVAKIMAAYELLAKRSLIVDLSSLEISRPDIDEMVRRVIECVDREGRYSSREMLIVKDRECRGELPPMDTSSQVAGVTCRECESLESAFQFNDALRERERARWGISDQSRGQKKQPTTENALIDVVPDCGSSLQVSYCFPDCPRGDSILILSVKGECGVGSGSNEDASYISCKSAEGVAAFGPMVVVFDYREMKYEWGDQLPLDSGLVPTFVVVGDDCKDAIETLLADCGADESDDIDEQFFDSIEVAVMKASEYLERLLKTNR